ARHYTHSHSLVPVALPPLSPVLPYTTLFRSPVVSEVGSPISIRRKIFMTSEARSPRLAVLIDADNASAKIADGLFEEIAKIGDRSEEHTSELQSSENLVCRLLLEKKKKTLGK